MKNLTLLASALFASLSSASMLSPDIQESSLVVYNGGIGLVHEKRSLTLNKNDTNIIYEDVANTIDTDSVNIKLTDSIKLYSQQYRFDKLTQQKLLNAHIDKKVEVRVLKDVKNFKIITATLLSSSANKSIVKTSNSKIITVDSNNIIFDTIPKELITKPSLVWNVQTDKKIKTDIEIDYLIKNISWKSNYILNVSKNIANLSGWISVDNRSGKKFIKTDLNLLAGDINMAKEERLYQDVRYAKMAMASAPVQHKAHEGYHIYKIPFKIDLANNEKTQIKFIDKRSIDIKRTFVSNLSNPLYLQNQTKHDVTQYINIKGLDFALPKGVVRTYSKINKQSILLGQSSLKHTPKNSPIELKLGTNFDLKVTQSILSRDDSKYQYSASVEYSVKNSSDEQKTVKLLIPFNKNKNSKVKTSAAFSYTEGNKIEFLVEVNANSTASLKASFISKK